MGQSRAMSLLEAVVNAGLGAAVALLVQLCAFPAFGIAVPLRTHLGLAAAFTAVSLIRSYLLRRLFERLRGRALP